jgi:hypothetical protein
MNMAAILAQVFSPATRTQCPNMGNEILIPMQQLQISKTSIGAKKSTGSLIWTIEKVLHYILISLICISISCLLLLEYSSFTIGILILCSNAADFESSMLVSRMVSIFSDCYDLRARFLLNILFFILFFAVPSQLIDFIAHNIILFEVTNQILLRAGTIKHESCFNMNYLLF